MDKYEIRFDKDGDNIICDECGHSHTKMFFEQYLCEFCANITGNSGTVVDKMMLSQAMNLLFKKLENIYRP